MQTHPACGTSLIEALVALLVLSIGLLALVRLQVGLQADAERARQRAQAMRLAQSTFEELRLAAHPGAAAEPLGPDIDPGPAEVGSHLDPAPIKVERHLDPAPIKVERHLDPGPVEVARHLDPGPFEVERHFDTEPVPGATAIRLETTWTDRHGVRARVELHGILAATDPGHTAALSLSRGAAWPHTAPHASPRLPEGVIDLRDGRSVLPPVAGSEVALRFDNLSGRVIERCTGLAGTDPDPTRLGPCSAIAGYWLGGVVRLDPALPPDPAWLADRPAPFAIRLVLNAGSYPHPADCRVGVVAAPGSDRYATWHCAVYPRHDGRWSGRVSLVPQGWTLGTVPGTRQVCRYVNPPDPDGRLDPNLMHPAHYVDVAGNLPNQNYLLIRGEDSCPVTGNNGDDPATTEPDPP